MKQRIDLSVTDETLEKESEQLGNPQKKPKIDKENAVNFLNGQPYSQRYYEILEVRKRLPAHDAKQQLIELMKENQVLILVGETGSGKTTQIPQFIL